MIGGRGLVSLVLRPGTYPSGGGLQGEKLIQK